MSMPASPELINSTWACYTPGFGKLHLPVNFVVIHRLSLERKTVANPIPVSDDRLDARSVSRVFSNPAMCTGGRVPYHVLIRKDCRVEQMLPLLVRGAHARKWNASSWAIAVVGDYNKEDMPPGIRLLTCQIASVLSVISNMGMFGHSELPESSTDPGKHCPGIRVGMDSIRRDTAALKPTGYRHWILEQRLRHITKAGFSL